MQSRVFKFFLILLFISAAIADPPGLRPSKLKRLIDWSGEKSLVARIYVGAGLFYLEPGLRSRIFEGEFLFDQKAPKIRYDVVGQRGELTVRFTEKSRKKDKDSNPRSEISSLNEIYDNECKIKLSPRIPIALRMELGAVKGEADLGGLQIEKMRLEVGVSHYELDFSQTNPIPMEEMEVEAGVGVLRLNRLGNANFQYFKFDGGLGSYELDFSGDFRQQADLDINVGMGKMIIYLPRHVGVRIKVSKSFLTYLDIDEVYKSGGYYYNENWGKTPYQMDIHIDAGIGKITIEWVD